ncbi:MAG: hypothetical protein ACRCU2_00525, partial [Planktothrix sp.]
NPPPLLRKQCFRLILLKVNLEARDNRINSNSVDVNLLFCRDRVSPIHNQKKHASPIPNY